MAFNYSPKVVTDGLVLYLDAANPNSYVSGSTTWRDISRGGNNGTLVGGPTYDSANGGSIVFDGVDDYVTAPSSNNWALGTNGAVSVWVYFTGSITTNHRLWCVNNNLFSLDVYLGGGGIIGLHGGQASTTSIFPMNQWVHIMTTYINGNLAVYFNGVNQSLTGVTSSYNITNSNSLFIGQYSGGGSYTWRGRISNLNIYKNKPFSPLEVLQNYNATKTRFGLT
jgi:hypothetical protein